MDTSSIFCFWQSPNIDSDVKDRICFLSSQQIHNIRNSSPQITRKQQLRIDLQIKMAGKLEFYYSNRNTAMLWAGASKSF